MRYTVEFIYADNDQIYSDDIECTPEEAVRLEVFLMKLAIVVGYIKLGGESERFVVPYTEPEFIGFGELQANWDDGLISTAKDHGITL